MGVRAREPGSRVQPVPRQGLWIRRVAGRARVDPSAADRGAVDAVDAPLEPPRAGVDDRVIERAGAGGREHAPAEPVATGVAVDHQRRAPAALERGPALGAARRAGRRRGGPGRLRGRVGRLSRDPRPAGRQHRAGDGAAADVDEAAVRVDGGLQPAVDARHPVHALLPREVDGAVRAAAAAHQAQRGEVRCVQPEGVEVVADVAERDRRRIARRAGREVAVEAGHDARRRRRAIRLQQRARAEAPAQPVLGAPHRSGRRGRGLRAIQGGRRGIGGAHGRREDQRPQRGEQQRGGRRERTDEDGGQTQVGSFEGPCIETAA